MKIKKPAALPFSERVNPPAIFMAETGIELQRQMRQPLSRPKPPWGFGS
jgi:hypothetical protein